MSRKEIIDIIEFAKTGKNGSDEKNGDAYEHHRLATVKIGKLTEDDRHCSLR